MFSVLSTNDGIYKLQELSLLLLILFLPNLEAPKNIFIGFVNTSFANENAMLTLLVIAIFISRSVRKFHLVSKAKL